MPEVRVRKWEREHYRNTEDKQLPLQTKPSHISKQVLRTTAKTFCIYAFLLW